MRFGCLILLMFVVLACGQEKKKETVNPLAYEPYKTDISSSYNFMITL